MVVVESHGLPIGDRVFSANHHEAGIAEPTLDSLKYLPKPKNLLGDTAYSSKPLTQRVNRKYHTHLTAPPKCHYVHPFHDGRRLRRSKRRWKVERCFAWLKAFKRLEVRWEVKAENYLGFVELACSFLLIPYALYG
jgi:transposase